MALAFNHITLGASWVWCLGHRGEKRKECSLLTGLIHKAQACFSFNLKRSPKAFATVKLPWQNHRSLHGIQKLGSNMKPKKKTTISLIFMARQPAQMRTKLPIPLKLESTVISRRSDCLRKAAPGFCSLSYNGCSATSDCWDMSLGENTGKHLFTVSFWLCHSGGDLSISLLRAP